MLEIVNLTHGEVLNRNHGKVNGNALLVKVIGLCRSGDKVKVNGIEADCCGESFQAEIPLYELENTITAETEGNRGYARRSIRVLCDLSPNKRINFCIDDNVWFLADIASQRPQSLFDHFYLKNIRRIHEQYNLKLTINLFYRDLQSDFTLSDFPDCYKNEWRDNSDWLKLSFHARSEFPDRIYQNAEVSELLADFDQVHGEINRFAGETTWIAPQNIHWSMVKVDALPELRKRGCTFQGGLFVNARTYIGEKIDSQPCCDIGYFENEENSLFLEQKHIWHDFRCNITMGTEAIILNLEPLHILEEKLKALFSEPNTMVLHMLTHEQYFFPKYKQYLPDHFDRLEMLARMAREANYKFVFFTQGFLGEERLGSK